ncbi:heparan sulfate 2-O-sulfotransferase pipe-like isoform X2 [Homarus americanus]|uniref:heparan sulfate 2-O-sulfotransferase pipe-like isoform X2 n=1 Tax=Homarus americanus TaxID=6706 RepID=UPI001C4554C2|nr:heparan sulfate 2-O-sulfotransferase pipe-like isoform X2 [Homarus americanus]
MKIRNMRVSDVVAAVCVPATLVMYIHLLLVSPQLNPSDAHQEYTAERSVVTTTTAVQEVGAPLNRTKEAREEVLLVTVLLRCGSTTIKNLLLSLSAVNKFTTILKPGRRTEMVHIPHTKMQRDIVMNISAYESPTAVIQPFAYINFTQFGKRKPIQISLVREPIERAVSWYYHMRAPFQLVERHIRFPETKLPSRKFLKKDLETCLNTPGDQECRYTPGKEILGHTVEFFCGHDPYCPIFGSREGLQQAKAVVEREFAVVGVLEDWNKTLTVLEHYVPRYFAHASSQYNKHIQGNKRKKNENFYKPKVDQAAKNFMLKHFTVESEFYDFIRQRLNQQYYAITGGAS